MILSGDGGATASDVILFSSSEFAFCPDGSALHRGSVPYRRKSERAALHHGDARARSPSLTIQSEPYRQWAEETSPRRRTNAKILFSDASVRVEFAAVRLAAVVESLRQPAIRAHAGLSASVVQGLQVDDVAEIGK
jgi:hypothetical protein